MENDINISYCAEQIVEHRKEKENRCTTKTHVHTLKNVKLSKIIIIAFSNVLQQQKMKDKGDNK